MLTTLAIANYRSLRNLAISLGRLNLSYWSKRERQVQFVPCSAASGQYGSRPRHSIPRPRGRTAIHVMGRPQVISRAVRNGDYPVQGTTRKNPINLRMGFASDEFGYLIDLGLPASRRSAFALDPEIKRECIWHGTAPRPSSLLVECRGPVVRVHGQDDWSIVIDSLASFDSMMMQIAIHETRRRFSPYGNLFARGGSTIILGRIQIRHRDCHRSARERRYWLTTVLIWLQQLRPSKRSEITRLWMSLLPMHFQEAKFK
jgi:hypothetical protein